MVVYSIVVPVYNEEAVIGETYCRLKAVMDSTAEPYEILFVNDGSGDKTMAKARAIAKKDANVKIISFSRNFGHQIAVTAGMDFAAGQAVIIIDADLQDPPEVMLEMFQKWKEGWQVVYGQRLQRQGETVFKKFTAKVFYRMLNAVTDTAMPVDAGDFRLLDRQVVDVMKTLPERNRYVRGLVSWVGFRQTSVTYVRHERLAGETKYPLRKMIRFAMDGMTSFSQKPLKVGNLLGILLCAGAVCVALYQLVLGLTGHLWNQMACWAALILFSQGLVLLCTGIQGAYLARMYDEAKGRPLYIVGEKIGLKD